ncbi:PREDICTED: uncharacterized protein LOC105560634 [Vollenhovia emeryi]|uniref:uncharacterized protein LOC105560634 n=1 Tax=Vollenhovia emeryi TaxID=411798 RepID=UPI0005F3F766|nr:PREDICTED: uncharacterized protein LOC105560634 [Vollenhovia emeryi]
MRYVSKQKSETARSGVSGMPIDNEIIRMISKRNRQSLLGNRVDGSPRGRRNSNLVRAERSLRKRKKCGRNSSCKIARRRHYVDDDDVGEQSASSNAARFPVWQVPESTAPAINSCSTTNPTIMETEMNNRSSLAFERPPLQLANLDHHRSVNGAPFPIGRYPNSRGLSDVNVPNEDSILSKVTNARSESKVGVQGPAFERPTNKMLPPAYRPGIPADVDSLNPGHPQGFQQQYGVHQRDSANGYNVKNELFDSNKRFLLVPISKNLYVLKNVRESPRTGGIVPERYKLPERNKDNATSDTLPFKARMHHDAKDVGRAHFQGGNHRLFDHNADFLRPTLVTEEIANPTENPVTYRDFLYPSIASQTRNLLDATPEIPDEQTVSPVPDYASISYADINLRGGINSYDSSGFSSTSIDIPNVYSKGNDGEPSVLPATELDDRISPQQHNGNYEDSLGYSGFNIELTTADSRDTFSTLDDNTYTPATFEMYLTKKGFVSQNLGDDSTFSIGGNEDEPVTEFADDISTRCRAAFDVSANDDNTLFPNVAYTFADNAGDVLNSEALDKDSQEYGISISSEYTNKSTYSSDFDYKNRSIDEAFLSNNTADVDFSLNAEDYVTAASLFPNTEEWPEKEAQSNVENSRVLLTALKPLSSELQKLLSAVKLVNQSLSDVQSRLCDKKNAVRIERESKTRKTTDKPANKVDRYDSDLFIESFNSQSSDKRRIKTKGGSVAERDVKIRRRPDDLFLNKLTTPFHKRESSTSNAEVGRRNFLKKRKLNEREFPKSGDVERRRLSHSRFNRNLKSLTKSYEMRIKPIRKLIETGLERTKRTTTSIRSSRLIKSNILSAHNFADKRAQNHHRNDQINRSITSNNAPSTFLDMFTKDTSAYFSSGRQNLQRNVKAAMSSEKSDPDKEKKILPIDPQFYKEATGYLNVIQLLGKTEEPHVERATDVWLAQNLTESLTPLIFTTTESSVSALTFPYFIEESTIASSSTIAKEATEVTESSLYEDVAFKISKTTSLTQSPITLSAFTITMPTTSPLFYTTELTVLPIEEISTTEVSTEKMTTILPVAITEVTGIPIPIPAIEYFTTETVMLLTPLLEGMTDITLKITIPVATETSIEETTALMIETAITEEETVEGTSTLATEITQSLLVETDVSLYTFSTVSLFKTREEELVIESTSPTVSVSTTLAIAKGFQTATSGSTFGLYNTTVIISSPTVLERTEMIPSTSTEVATTTLIPEEESPVTQIEKTITAEETATEIPTATPTEIAITTTEVLTEATELPTSTETTITEMLTVNKTLTTAEASISTETPTASEIPTTAEASTITEILTPAEILTTLKTPIIKETTSAETLTPAETSTSIKTQTPTEFLTSTETITSEISTTVEATTITETLTSTEILTTVKTPTTKETTSAKALTSTETLTSIETKTSTKTSTTTEISTSRKTTITEILTINKTLSTAKTPAPIETSTVSEIPTTSTKSTAIEATTITETLTPTEILTTLRIPITKETTSAKTLTPTVTLTPIETKVTTETFTPTEISASTETTAGTKILTITETLTTIGTSAFTETSTTSEIPTTAKIAVVTETSTPSEILTTTKISTKRTTSIKALTSTITEAPSTTETLTTTESSRTTEIPVMSTTYITTTFFTTSESAMSSVATTSPKEFFPTSNLTTFTTILATETAESTLISSTPVTATSAKTTVPTLKLTIMPLRTLITNTTLSETPYTTISSTFSTTERSVLTSFETTVPTTSLKIATTTPLSLVTSTMLSETPSTTLSTFLIEETTTSSILTTFQTTTVLPIPTAVSTVETFLTTSSIAIYTENATVSSTTASAITAETFESTISPVVYFTVTTPSTTNIPITTPVIVDTETTAYETTSTLVTSFVLTETIEGTSSPMREYEETKEYKEYYESTKEEIATATSAAELTTEEYTTWVTEEVTIAKETPMTYLPSFTTPFFIETTTEATSFSIETITLPTTTEEMLSTEKIVTVTPMTTIEEIPTLSEAALISTETSIIETSSLVPAIATTTASLLEETVTEITETSWIITTSEKPEYATILEAVVTVTLAPFSESILSILITPETPATTPEVISVLPKTVSEEFTMSMTESSSVMYATKGFTTPFIETTVHPAVSLSTAITEERLEVETEYYVAKEPFEEEYEEYEEYDTEIPTAKWYYYDEYETTTEGRTTALVKYTKLPKEKASPPLVRGTTSSYEMETSGFTRYSTTSTYGNVTSAAVTSETSYAEEEVTSTLETYASTIIENVTMVEAETVSSMSEKTELTFGSTEEYTLPSSTIFRIPTEPLEYLTIPPRYTDLERFTKMWHDVTLPKFITRPEKIPKIVLEKTTTSERVSTETETVEKLTSFFISSALTTLSEKEAFEVRTTTMSTASSETEGTLETGYEVTTLAITEETVPRVTPFITPETEIVEREEKEQLLRRLDDLKQHEREVAEREERLKEKEQQWNVEKEKRRKMMQREKEKAKNITIAIGTTEGYITTTVLTASPVEAVSTTNLTASTTEVEVTSPGLYTFITTSSFAEITIPTETTPFSITEEITFVTYTTEKTGKEITEESTFTTYTTEETEETVTSYTTEKSTFVIRITEEMEKEYITDYVTLTPYMTTSIMDLYSFGLASIETTTFYTTEEMYTASYVSETTPFSVTEEITSVAYTTEKTEEAATERGKSTTEETEETVISYATEKSTTITYLTEEVEEVQITDYVTLTPYITTSVMDLYSFGSASIETTTFYTTEEMYTASYVTETIPFSVTEEIISVAYTTEKTEEAATERGKSTTEETEETVISYATEKSTTNTFLTEEVEEVQITDYVTLTPYVTTSIVDLYNVGLASIETATPYTVEEMYTTSYVTLYSEPLTFASPTITSTLATEKFTLPIATFSERFEEVASVTLPTWYTTEETYTDIYGKPLFIPSTLEFTSATTSSTLAIITATEVKYDEEIERLKEKLREKERELEEREKILLEREERLARDIMEFEKYMEEFEKKKTSIASTKKSTVLTSLSTPVPPTEKTTIKAQLTTQVKKVTEKKENRTTTKLVTSRQTEMEDIHEGKRTKPVPEEAVTLKEEEIVTKRICLNVLENTTIPLDKRRRDIVTKKICLPYFPEKNEEKLVGRLSRRLLALQSTRKIRRPRWNVSSDPRCHRRAKETTRKIDNLQLLHHEWLNNETTKPLRHFKGFTRIYGKMRKIPKRTAAMEAQEKTTSDFQDKTSLYERAFNYYESIFQPTVTPMLDSKEHRKRKAFFSYDLISAKNNNFLIDDETNIRKRDVSPIESNARFWSRKSTANTSSQRATTITTEEGRFYTVNVLHLSYNEDKQTHEVVSAKPDEDKLTILSESNDVDYVSNFGTDRKITSPYDEVEDEDYIEDMIDNYMNYEEHETSTWTHVGRFLDDAGKDKGMTENEKELLDQAWPTEKSTTYHLGGTRFWEFDFVTEPSAVSRTVIDESKTIDVSVTRTTCLDVVLRNERNSEVKSNVSYHKRDVYGNRRRESVSIEKRNASLRNVTRRNALRYKLRTKRPGIIAKKLKSDSQKLRGSNYSKRSFKESRTARFNDSRLNDNVDSITAKSRKLCGVNASKLKHKVVNHEDATDKHKKKQLAKSRTLQKNNLHSLRDNCDANNKNKYHKTAANPPVKNPHQKNDEKVTHLNIVGRKNNSTSTLHGRKIHNCSNCICDVASVVSNIRSLLDRTSFQLDEIKALNCSEYKEIQDKIVISMDSDMEEAREFPQPHYNIESLKGQKYIKLEELEDNFESDLELDSDHDVVSLPGINLNLPCNQDGDGITWLSSVSRPSYTWKRTDGIALFGFVAENGDLELRNVNAKDTGNYTCVMTYTSPDNEEPVETAYEIHLQVVTLPRYVVHGESRYHVRSCDERDLDVLVTYLPLKLNSVICEADVCNAYVLTPSCSRSQITVDILLVPSHIVKPITLDPKHCNVFCLKAVQDKFSLTLSKNLQIFLGKTIIFRLPHYEQRLVPIVEKSSPARRKRGRTDANASAGRSSNVGLFSSCPAGYGLRDTRCVPCNMGTYSEGGISHCKRCPAGTYQPNHGARVCRTCTNPMTKGCHNMLWNSFSAVMVTLASVGAMLSICLLLLWLICCAKKKFCIKRMAGVVAKEDAFEPEKRAEEQPLIKDASENEDQQWDSEYRAKRKKGKFYVNTKRRKQNERRKYGKTHAPEDEWGSHRIKNAPIIFPDSYQSHEDYNNYYPRRSYRKGPRLPEYDFDT